MNDDWIVESAPSKINLTLSVFGRQSDGYHLLQSLVVFTEFGDELSLLKGNEFSLTVDGPFAGDIEGENVIQKIAKNLIKDFDIDGIGAVRLWKELPVAAGVGGGTADAGAFVRLVQRLFEGKVDPSDLRGFAAQFGADVPVCIQSCPSIMYGYGEKLLPLKTFPQMGILLVNPRIQISTGEVFSNLNMSADERSYDFKALETLSAGFHSIDDVIAYMNSVPNDLTKPAIAICSDVQTVIETISRIENCRVARMSGSGATCFGLFETVAAAKTAAATLEKKYPGWWIRSSRVLPC